MKWTFENFQPGYFGTFGPQAVHRDEIVAFATDFDPQPMHIDEEAGRNSLLGGLAGSGWHMTALAMRMAADHFLNATSGARIYGIDEVRWMSPFFPDQPLMLSVDVLSAETFAPNPACGLVTFRLALLKADAKPMMTVDVKIVMDDVKDAGAAKAEKVAS